MVGGDGALVLDGNGDAIRSPRLHSLTAPDGNVVTTHYATQTIGKSNNYVRSRTTFTASQEGRYAVAASVENSDDLATGPYQFRVHEEFAANASTRAVIAIGSSMESEIESNREVDWIAVDFTKGRKYQIDIENVLGLPLREGVGDPFLRGIHDAAGQFIDGTVDHDSGNYLNDRLTHNASYTGRHYLVVRGTSANTGAYLLSVTDTTPADWDSIRGGATDLGDITNTFATATTAGTFGPSDITDYFAVTLTETRQVFFSLEEQAGDITLYLEALSGDIVGSTILSDGDNRLLYKTLDAGTYYLRAESETAGSYVLAYLVDIALPAPTIVLVPLETAEQGEQPVSEPANGDLPGNSTTTGRAIVDAQAVSGRLSSYNDADWFKVESLTQGHTYEAYLWGHSYYYYDDYDAYSFAPRVQVYSDDGTVRVISSANTIADGDNWLSRHRVTFSVPSGVTSYNLEVTRPIQSPYVGDYTLTVTDLGLASNADTPGNSSTSRTIGTTAKVTDTMNFYFDHDWFKTDADLQAGTEYLVIQEPVIETLATSPGVWPELVGIYTSAGRRVRALIRQQQYIVPKDAAGDQFHAYTSRMRFTPSATGAYFIDASDHYRSIGNYTLELMPISHDRSKSEPRGKDFPGDVTTEGVLTVGAGNSVHGNLGFHWTNKYAGHYDRDTFAMKLTGGQDYQIVVTYGHDALHIRLRNPTGSQILAATPENDAETTTVEFTASTSGTHFVEIEAVGNKGNYSITLTER